MGTKLQSRCGGYETSEAEWSLRNFKGGVEVPKLRRRFGGYETTKAEWWLRNFKGGVVVSSFIFVALIVCVVRWGVTLAPIL